MPNCADLGVPWCSGTNSSKPRYIPSNSRTHPPEVVNTARTPPIMAMTVPIENSNQIGIVVSSSISILLAAVSVGLRLVAKRIGLGLDYSDYCIVAALVCQSAPTDACSRYDANHGTSFATLHYIHAAWCWSHMAASVFTLWIYIGASGLPRQCSSLRQADENAQSSEYIANHRIL